MARAVRVAGRVLWVLLPLLAVGLFLALPQRVVRASYSDPYWDQNSASPECICETCGCEGPSEWSPEGVSWRTGALRFAIPLFDTPSREGRNVYSLIWRSDISGASQFGNGIVPSFLRTLEITQDGAVVYDRLPSGLIITWERSGTYPDYTWSTSDCVQ